MKSLSRIGFLCDNRKMRAPTSYYYIMVLNSTCLRCDRYHILLPAAFMVCIDMHDHVTEPAVLFIHVSCDDEYLTYD